MVVLPSHLKFPFQAVVASRCEAATLTPSERMTVLSMADETECEHELLVTADWDGMIEDVRLEVIWRRDADAETLRAVSDWPYWVGRGYQL